MIWEYPVFDENGMTKYGWRVIGREGNFWIGSRTDIGAFSLIVAHNSVIIEEGALIGSHCSIYSKSTVGGLKEGMVFIGKDAQIGAHSVIMPGVTIGEGAVVGAMSFVNKNVEPFTVVYGVPARFVKCLK